MDVTKIGRIPDGGVEQDHGAAHLTTARRPRPRRRLKQLTHSETNRTNQQPLVPSSSPERSASRTSTASVTIRNLITDIVRAYRHGTKLGELLTDQRVTHRLIQTHCPRHNGKVERFNHTLASEWAYGMYPRATLAPTHLVRGSDYKSDATAASWATTQQLARITNLMSRFT